MLSLKNSEIESLGNSAALSSLVKHKHLPPSITFKLAIFMQRFLPILTAFQEAKQRLIAAYADKDSSGAPIQQGQQYLITVRKDEFLEKYKELLQGDIEIECKKIKVTITQFPQGIISASEMLELLPIIEFVESE